MNITLHKNVRNKSKPRCLKGGGGFAVYGAKARVRSCIDAFRHVVFRQWHDLSELNLSVGFIT